MPLDPQSKAVLEQMPGAPPLQPLSPQQARAFQRAIAANRRLEKTLSAMRQISQKALTKSLPGVKKTRDTKKATTEA